MTLQPSYGFTLVKLPPDRDEAHTTGLHDVSDDTKSTQSSGHTTVVHSSLPTFYLTLSCLLAGVSQGSNAFHLAIVNIPQQHIEAFLNQSSVDHYGRSFAQSELNLIWGFINGGPVLIAMLAVTRLRWIAETLGRKRSLFFFHNGINLVACLLSLLAKCFNRMEPFLIGRVVFGVSMGLGISLSSIYITECSPPEHRGKMGAFLGTSGTSLFTTACVLGLPELLGTEEHWHYIYVICIGLLLTIGVIAFVFLSESPKYLYITKHNPEAAEKALWKLYGPGFDKADVFGRFETESSQAQKTKKVNFLYILKHYHLRQGLFVGIAAALGRACCGINIMYAYSVRLLNRTLGIEMLTAKYVAVAMNAPQLIACISTLILIDKIPRRKMFLTTLGAMTILYALFVVFSAVQEYDLVTGSRWPTYVAIVCIVASSWIFPLGVTPIGFILVSEVTPQSIRSIAVGVAMTCLYLGLLVHNFLFPMLHEVVGSFSIFLLVVLPEAVIWTYLFFRMPETMGHSVEQVIQRWIDQDTLKKTDKDQKLIKLDPETL